MKNLLEVFSFKAYEGIHKERFSKCVGFFFILLLVISFLISLQFTFFTKTRIVPQLNYFIAKILTQLADGFPETVIEKGVLTSPQQTFVREFKENDLSFAVIIEPDESKTQALLDTYQSCMLLTKQKLVFKSLQQGRTKMEVYDLKNVSYLKIMPLPSGFKMISDNKQEFTFTSETAAHFLKKAMFFVWPVSFLLIFLYFCIAKTIQVLFFSLISLLIGAISSVRLSYQELLAIGIYALAPPTLILAVLQAFTGKPFFGQAFLFTGIYVLYLYKGITINKAVASNAGG